MTEKQKAIEAKRGKAQGREIGWFQLYIELKTEMQQQLFELETRIKRLESANEFRTDMRIRGTRQ